MDCKRNGGDTSPEWQASPIEPEGQGMNDCPLRTNSPKIMRQFVGIDA